MAGLSISERCRRAGIDRKTYYQRLARGKTDLFAPPKIKKKISSETLKLLEQNGIKRSAYFTRLRRGWSEFEASHVAPYSDVYRINGKSVFSQLTKTEYCNFYTYIDRYGLTIEEAFKKANKGLKNDSTKCK